MSVATSKSLTVTAAQLSISPGGPNGILCPAEVPSDPMGMPASGLTTSTATGLLGAVSVMEGPAMLSAHNVISARPTSFLWAPETPAASVKPLMQALLESLEPGVFSAFSRQTGKASEADLFCSSQMLRTDGARLFHFFLKGLHPSGSLYMVLLWP